ncbi:MAG: GTP-binding protein [Oscillospiraceae bacterium]|nr:GTP-binding protein [Oscillospiraceae bacterium]
MLGDSGVGKTSIINAVYNRFSRGEKPTVGATSNHLVVTANHKAVELDIWDTAGQERFRALTPLYTRNADAAILVCDYNNPDSLANLANWFTPLRECCHPLDIVVVGNKSDELNEKQLNDFKKELAMWANDNIPEKIALGWFITSALTGENIHELIEYLAKSLVVHSSAESLALEEKSQPKCSC